MSNNTTLAMDAAGLGLRRALLSPLQDAEIGSFDFLELAADNWIGVGGRFGEAFEKLAARYPLVCHGLSLSLGGVEPFDDTYLQKLRRFLEHYKVPIFSEHLSYCADDGQLYDLMPLPFTEEAVKHVAARINRVQDALGRRMAIENISYYAAPFQAMSELDFINAILSETDCEMLLDVNNVFVNSINHRYDAVDFITQLPSERIVYMHIAGHFDEADDLKIDTHGAAVKDAVWGLLDVAYRCHGPRPTLLERDFNFPPFAHLLAEVQRIREVVAPYHLQEISCENRHVG